MTARDGAIRFLYLIAALCPLGAVFGAVGMASAIENDLSHAPNGAIGGFMLVPLVMAAMVFVAIVTVFLWMAWRPRWWGKLICLVGFPWIMFSAIGGLESNMPNDPELGGFFHNPVALYAPGIAWAVLMLVGIALLVLDPRFSDSPKPSA